MAEDEVIYVNDPAQLQIVLQLHLLLIRDLYGLIIILNSIYSMTKFV